MAGRRCGWSYKHTALSLRSLSHWRSPGVLLLFGAPLAFLSVHVLPHCGGGHLLLLLAFELSWYDSVGLGLAVPIDSLMHFPERGPVPKTMHKNALVITRLPALRAQKLNNLSPACKKRVFLSSASESPPLIAYSFSIPTSWHH